MPRRLKPEELVRRRGESERVRFILNTCCGGNQSLLAERLPASQSLISKVVRGEQMPGRKLMEKLARLPGINPAWVLEGVGEPLLPPRKGTLPIALGVLPGWPEHYPHMLTGGRHTVAEADEGESRYWLRVQEHWPLVQVTAWGILPGDLLLMDSSPDWTAREDMVMGRLCGVRLDRQSGTTFEIGRVERDATGIVLALAKVIGRLIEPTPPPPSRPPEPRPTPGEEEYPKTKVTNPHTEQVRQWRRQQAQLRREREQGLGTFTFADIVAVCVYLVRPTPASTSAVRAHEGDNG
jgi:hypothetical protein